MWTEIRNWYIFVLVLFFLFCFSVFFIIIISFISVSPEIKLQSMHYVEREQSASLHCQVEGYPTPTITWTPCNNLQGNVCDKSRLNVPRVKRDNVYVCTAINSLGCDSASTKLSKCLLTRASFFKKFLKELLSFLSKSPVDEFLESTFKFPVDL